MDNSRAWIALIEDQLKIEVSTEAVYVILGKSSRVKL